MRKHPVRALTVLVGIALGAAVFTSVRLSIHASLDSFTRSMAVIAGRADRVVLRPGGHVPEGLVPLLLRQSSVERVSPLLTTYIRPASKDADPFLLIGFDPILDRFFRDWQIEDSSSQRASWLKMVKDPYTLIIGRSLAIKLKRKPNDVITIEHARQNSDFRVVGTLLPEGLALVEGGLVA
ncbi:MAG: ABC transporter permease, partial [Desulfobacterales bacterium]